MVQLRRNISIDFQVISNIMNTSIMRKNFGKNLLKILKTGNLLFKNPAKLHLPS